MKNIFGVIIVIVGAYIFQFGFKFMTEDMKQKFARKFVEKIDNIIQE